MKWITSVNHNINLSLHRKQNVLFRAHGASLDCLTAMPWIYLSNEVLLMDLTVRMLIHHPQ